jgi:hypothetical protein
MSIDNVRDLKQFSIAQTILTKSPMYLTNLSLSTTHPKSIWSKRSNYNPIESTYLILTDFPELSLDEIKEITMGVYQMNI